VSRKPSKSLTEQLEEMEAFKEGVLALVQKYFGRKPRKVATKVARSNGASKNPHEEAFQ
jgi:hypothetical protein